MNDFSNEVTCFIITAGEDPNFPVCEMTLDQQDCKFKKEIIKNYFPMSVAFQEMLNRCDTPYYIQVDGDMVLHKNTVALMLERIKKEADPNIAMHCYMLRDVHLDMPIYGIKIYKTEVFKKYPYNLEHPSCEVEQLDRMKADGYEHKLFEDIVGEHSPHWTDKAIFERYYNLMQKFRIYRYIWMGELPKKLYEIFKNKPDMKNFYAIAGAMAGIYSDNMMDEEKDNRKVRKEYGRLKSFFCQPHQLTLYVGNTCNFKCNFCERAHGKIPTVKDMSVEIADEAIYKFPHIKALCLCGFSEPLTSPNLVPILQRLKSAGKYVGVITNGSLLKKRLPELTGWWKPDYISISLNASNAELHEKTTNTKTFDTVIEGIKALLTTGIECYVSSVVSLENINDVPNLLKLCESLGVKTVHLHNILPHASDVPDQWFWDNVLQTKHQNLIDEIKELPEAHIVKKYPVLIDRSGGKGTCTFPWYSFSVDGDGNLSYCNSVLPAHPSMGNLKDFVVWNSEQAEKFRDKYCDGKLPHCEGCFRNFDMNF
jgi:MoaA/NifB/PqqE/SkfB family radical SAM enzyme